MTTSLGQSMQLSGIMARRAGIKLQDSVLNLRAGLHTHSSNPTHSVSNVNAYANQRRFTHVRLRRTSTFMLFLHVLLLFVLGTSVVAIPVSRDPPGKRLKGILKNKNKSVESVASRPMTMEERIAGFWICVSEHCSYYFESHESNISR